MFTLVKLENSNGLSQVEDIPYTHIQYISDNQTYLGEISPAPACFITSGWFKYLADYINEFKFIDGYVVDRLFKIQMHQQIKPVTIEDLQLEIKLLKETIALMLQPDILIETHTYPSWDTFEQFKQLAGWKYFEAAENSSRYFTQHDPKCSYAQFKDKYDEHPVCIGYWQYCNGHKFANSRQPSIILLDDIASHHKINSDAYILYSGFGSCNPYGIKKEILLNSIDCNYYVKCSTWEGTWPKPDIDLFHRSIKTYSIDYYITVPIYQYALKHLLGWFLLNWRENICYEIYLTIDVTDVAKFNIYKKQKKIIKLINPHVVLMLPTLKSVTINGVEYC